MTVIERDIGEELTKIEETLEASTKAINEAQREYDSATVAEDKVWDKILRRHTRMDDIPIKWQDELRVAVKRRDAALSVLFGRLDQQIALRARRSLLQDPHALDQELAQREQRKQKRERFDRLRAREPKRDTRDCMCGCGGQTKGGRFLPGHDSTLKARLVKIARDPKTKPSEKKQVLAHLESLGWSKYV